MAGSKQSPFDYLPRAEPKERTARVHLSKHEEVVPASARKHSAADCYCPNVGRPLSVLACGPGGRRRAPRRRSRGWGADRRRGPRQGLVRARRPSADPGHAAKVDERRRPSVGSGVRRHGARRTRCRCRRRCRVLRRVAYSRRSAVPMLPSSPRRVEPLLPHPPVHRCTVSGFLYQENLTRLSNRFTRLGCR